ncbi:ribosomal protein L18 [Alkaliphilus metalliredigens QYMF]|uniref:Large ribosomal subunit protein uL18 n=1 Tax=Alkaliphilus metalliredigens (strain QYMF) TaxID=293826 RepID=RL18_ALKMQ|nr:50S ribosomal protein L18 [Alkaliphilus metalliredigens]A6TWG6.1 RecName: Full=Large ribosomal subunit protein uL18; AltName: Full=50S ribosomal protein L18 [Alkaliphilus metalliredigens QYMF]ABR50534.1 ribosomal protein L18 [Alkaliphilus metalliredigens QYMF]
MLKKVSKNTNRQGRHQRVRNKITGTSQRPRLNVYRSLNHIYAQVIDDVAGITLVAASTLDEAIKSQVEASGNQDAAKLVGELVGKRALEKGVSTVTFDRGGYIYHGRVKALADGAREAGLKF